MTAMKLSHLLLEICRYRSRLAPITSSSPVLVIRGWNKRDRIAVVAKRMLVQFGSLAETPYSDQLDLLISILLEKRSGRQHSSLAALNGPILLKSVLDAQWLR